MNVYHLLTNKYGSNPKKLKVLKRDFNDWLSGKIKEPKTDEIKKIIRS